MVKINLNIEKKDLWLLSAIMVFLIAVGYVIAYGSGSPSTMGHSFGELENVQYKITNGMSACSAANQAIKTINPDTGAVVCETTKCNTAGSCAQVCIGSTCRTSWPSAATCSYGGRTYSPGAICWAGQCLQCSSNGLWGSGEGCNIDIVC